MRVLRQSIAPLVAILLMLGLTGCQSMLPKGSPADPETSAIIDSDPDSDTTTTASTTPEPEPTSPTGDSKAPPGPARSIGERLRRGTGLEIPENRRIAQQRQWFLDRPEYLERVEQRAAPFLHFIAEEIESRHLPSELAVLPVIESAFVTRATSPDRAAGIWQFMPATGRQFGLRQDWWYDGRRDVVASTRAALNYLTQLRDDFDGDWALALAAYNAGPARVRRAQRHNAGKGLGTDFWALDLPRETEAYVPRFLALANLLQQPRDGIELFARTPNKPQFAVVDTGGQLDLTLAADLAGVEVEEIKRLNPGFKRWATSPEGPHLLGVPLHRAGDFSVNLAGLDPKKRIRWDHYRIRRGDSLGVIAQRHGITVAALKRANNLRGNLIRAGKSLLIPRAYDSAQSARQVADASEAPEPTANRLVHVVRPGDTLWDIAREYGVNYRELADWNELSPLSTLRPGHKLVILVQEELAREDVAQPNKPI